MLTTTLFSIAVTVGSLNGTSGIAAPAQQVRELPAVVPASRPKALVPLYGSLIALQGADVYFTARALSNGASEVNPIVKPVAGKTAAAMAVKTGSTALAIYFVERAWKQNRKGAVIVAAVLNVATTAVVVHNARH